MALNIDSIFILRLLSNAPAFDEQLNFCVQVFNDKLSCQLVIQY